MASRHRSIVHSVCSRNNDPVFTVSFSVYGNDYSVKKGKWLLKIIFGNFLSHSISASVVTVNWTHTAQSTTRATSLNDAWRRNYLGTLTGTEAANHCYRQRLYWWAYWYTSVPFCPCDPISSVVELSDSNGESQVPSRYHVWKCILYVHRRVSVLFFSEFAIGRHWAKFRSRTNVDALLLWGMCTWMRTWRMRSEV